MEAKQYNKLITLLKKAGITALGIFTLGMLVYFTNSQSYSQTPDNSQKELLAKELQKYEAEKESAQAGYGVTRIIFDTGHANSKYGALYTSLKSIEILSENGEWITLQSFNDGGKLINLHDLAIVSTDFGKVTAPAGVYKSIRFNFDTEKTFAVDESQNRHQSIKTPGGERGSLEIKKSFSIRQGYYNEIAVTMDLYDSVLSYDRFKRLHPSKSISAGAGDLIWQPEGALKNTKSTALPQHSFYRGDRPQNNT